MAGSLSAEDARGKTWKCSLAHLRILRREETPRDGEDGRDRGGIPRGYGCWQLLDKRAFCPYLLSPGLNAAEAGNPRPFLNPETGELSPFPRAERAAVTPGRRARPPTVSQRFPGLRPTLGVKRAQ